MFSHHYSANVRKVAYSENEVNLHVALYVWFDSHNPLACIEKFFVFRKKGQLFHQCISHDE